MASCDRELGNLMKWKLWLLVTACGSLAIITGYLALTFVEQRAAVTAGGFASAQEMALLHRLGYGTKAEYLLYLKQHKEKERKEKQSKEQLEEKKENIYSNIDDMLNQTLKNEEDK